MSAEGADAISFFPLCRAFSAQTILYGRSRGVAPGYYISRLQREDPPATAGGTNLVSALQ
jgi:hypothetical protein